MRNRVIEHIPLWKNAAGEELGPILNTTYGAIGNKYLDYIHNHSIRNYDDVKENKKEKSMDKSEIRVIIQNAFVNEFNSKKEKETEVKDKKIKNSNWYKAVIKCYSDLYATAIELKKNGISDIDYLLALFPDNSELNNIMKDYNETLRKLREVFEAEKRKVLALLDVCETYEQVRDLLAEYNIVPKI